MNIKSVFDENSKNGDFLVFEQRNGASANMYET
jgi:hypothetical protein